MKGINVYCGYCQFCNYNNENYTCEKSNEIVNPEADGCADFARKYKRELSYTVKGMKYCDKRWFGCYKSMMERCYKKNSNGYKDYGGRGITVCDEWKNLKGFAEWEKEHPYFEGATLERIDVNGNYEPSNVKWATRKEQANNRRNNIKLEYMGECHSLSEWAELLGINYFTLRNRYARGDRGERLFRTTRYYLPNDELLNHLIKDILYDIDSILKDETNKTKREGIIEVKDFLERKWNICQ